MEKDGPSSTNQKRVGVAILITDKIEFNSKTFTRDKKEHHIMKKNLIHQDVRIVNVHTPNSRNSKYMKQTLT